MERNHPRSPVRLGGAPIFQDRNELPARPEEAGSAAAVEELVLTGRHGTRRSVETKPISTITTPGNRATREPGSGRVESHGTRISIDGGEIWPSSAPRQRSSVGPPSTTVTTTDSSTGDSKAPPRVVAAPPQMC